MIISIALKDKHIVNLDSYGRLWINNDTKVSLKEIPFVRYKFNQYTTDELKYILDMRKKFKHSVHMVEIPLDENILDYLNILKDVDHLVRYIYIPIYDDDVVNGLNEETVSLIKKLLDYDTEIDRIMIKDNSSTLDNIRSLRLKKQIADILKINMNGIGICNSPLSFDSRNACLTAVKARELAAKYHHEDDLIALPSANHETMNTCGCIRYYTINHDIIPLTAYKNNTNKTNNTKPRSSVRTIAKW